MFQSISASLKLEKVLDGYDQRFGHLASGDSFSCLIYKGKTDKIRLPRTSETEVHEHELKEIFLGYQLLTLKLSNLVIRVHGRNLVPINAYVKGNPQLLYNVVGKISKVELIMQTSVCRDYLRSV